MGSIILLLQKWSTFLKGQSDHSSTTQRVLHCNMNKLKKLPKGIPKPPAALKKVTKIAGDIQEGVSTFNETVSNVTDGISAVTEGVQAVSGLMPSHSNVQYEQPMARQTLQGEHGTVPPGGQDAPAADYSTKVQFDEAFVEPEGAETIDCWKNILRVVYTFFNRCTYNFCMFVLGLFVVICWGITYSTLIWIKVWCILPMTSVVLVFVKGCLPLILEPMGMFCQVCCGHCKKKGMAASA